MSDKGPIFDMLSGDLPVCTLEKNMTKEDVEEYAASIERYVKEKKRGFILTITGWDDDPRGLHEIPEAGNFLKMVMETGFFSLLDVTTTMNLKGNPWYGVFCPGIGAFEAYLIATGQMTKLAKLSEDESSFSAKVTKDTFEQFGHWLYTVSNPKLEQSIAAAKKRGPIRDVPGFEMSEDGVKDTSVSEELTGKVPKGSQRIDPMAPLKKRRPKWLK